MSSPIHRQSNRIIFMLASVIAILILVNGSFAYWQMNKVKWEFFEVANRDLPLAAELLPLLDRQFEQTLIIEKLHGLEDHHKQQVIHMLEDSFLRTGQKFEETSATLNEMLIPMLNSPRAITRKEMVKVEVLLGQIIQEHSQYQHQVISMIENMKNADAPYPEALIQLLEDEEKDLTNELIGLRDLLQGFTQESARAVEEHEAWVMRSTAFFTLFVFLLGAIMLMRMRIIMLSREQALDKINFYATYDPLTKLFNRRHFFEELEGAIKTASKMQVPLSLCVCDLDHFKLVNDRRGHQVGDKVLEGFADALKANIRTRDFVGRFGGDEFVICFPETTAEEAAGIVERIRDLFSKQIFRSDAGEFGLTSTFGIAELDLNNPNHDHLMEVADKALYRAKEKGRNNVEYLNALN